MNTTQTRTAQQPPVVPVACKCGTEYEWCNPKAVTVHMSPLHAYVACGQCGTEGPPVVILPLGPRGAVRAAIEGWNEKHGKGVGNG